MVTSPVSPTPDHLRKLLRLVAGLFIVLALGAACSGPSGVEVSHDWRGVDGFVATDVDGLVTVAGLDPERSRARNLAVLPGRDDDDPVSGPVVARRRNGDALLIRPATGGRDVLYRIESGNDALSRVGGLTRGARLYPWTDGWVEVAPSGSGASARALRSDLTQVFAMQLPITPDVVATDGAHRLCVAANGKASARLVTVDLQRQRSSEPIGLPSTIGVLGCTDQGPLVGVEVDPGAAGDSAPTARLVDGRVRMLEVDGGRLDALLVDGRTGYAVVGSGNALSALTVDLRSERMLDTHPLGKLEVADDAFLTGRSLVVAGDDRAAVMDLRTGAVASMKLAGPVFPG